MSGQVANNLATTSGLVAIVYGVSLWSPAAAWIAGGIVAVMVGIGGERIRAENEQREAAAESRQGVTE